MGFHGKQRVCMARQRNPTRDWVRTAQEHPVKEELRRSTSGRWGRGDAPYLAPFGVWRISATFSRFRKFFARGAGFGHARRPSRRHHAWITAGSRRRNPGAIRATGAAAGQAAARRRKRTVRCGIMQLRDRQARDIRTTCAPCPRSADRQTLPSRPARMAQRPAISGWQGQYVPSPPSARPVLCPVNEPFDRAAGRVFPCFPGGATVRPPFPQFPSGGGGQAIPSSISRRASAP